MSKDGKIVHHDYTFPFIRLAVRNLFGISKQVILVNDGISLRPINCTFLNFWSILSWGVAEILGLYKIRVNFLDSLYSRV